MSVIYDLNEYVIVYGQEFYINSPNIKDIDSSLSFKLNEDFNQLIYINENDGSIVIYSNIYIGIYNLEILYDNLIINIKIIVKPNILYKITSFYNKLPYSNFSPIINPAEINDVDIDYFKFDEEYDNIIIDSKTGIISFDEKIIADNFNLVIKCSIKNIEVVTITTFNIYPILKYKETNYYCEKWDNFKTDNPDIYPLNGIFKFTNDFSGIYIDSSSGIITINKPKCGSYNLTINYKVNNVSINTSIGLNIKPLISYEKNLVDFNNLISLLPPTISDTGGIFKLDDNDFNKNLYINSSNGKITINSIIPTGNYFIKILYCFNNYTCNYICELCISPVISYNNTKIEINYTKKDQTEIPYTTEDMDGTFTLINNIENIFINPKNGIIYFNNSLEVNDYLINVNYNKNNVNKTLQVFLKVKPIIILKSGKDQTINYYEDLNDIIIETNPNGGLIKNNLNIHIENNLVKLSEFDKKVGVFELRMKYTYNNIVNTLIYNFTILPYIFYNKNIINLSYKQNFTSDSPSFYPLSGTFSLENEIKYIIVDQVTGAINIKSGLKVGIYDIKINYLINGLINFTNYKIFINPTYNISNNNSIYEHNPYTNIDKHKLEPLNVNPLGGTFSSDLFEIENGGIIIIPSNLDVNKYIINIKYNYKGFETCFQYFLDVIQYNLRCIFKQQPKIYDGTVNVKLKYITPNNLSLNLVYDANFENNKVGNDNLISIKNIKVIGDTNNNFNHSDVQINGSIKPCKLEIEFVGIDKIFDGTNIANVNYNIKNKVDNDDIKIKSLTCLFENINVGFNKIIITNIVLEGDDLKNYYIENKYETFAKITKKSLLVSFKSPIHIFNKKTNVNLEIESITGFILNERIRIESFTANFIDPNIGNDILINVTNIKIINNNYEVLPTTLYGSIIEKEININIIPIDKIYDGTNQANITFEDNELDIIDYEALYEDRNVGFKKKIFVKNITLNNKNYIIKNTIINGNILPLTLDVEYQGQDKYFDNNKQVNGKFIILNKIEYDDINIDANISFNTTTAEDNKSLVYNSNNIKVIGNDSRNYKVFKIKLNKPCIFKVKLEIEFVGIDKLYDSTCNASVKIKNINNKLPNDNVKIKSYKATFEDKNTGENKKIKITNIELINDYGNYYCEDIVTFATITKKKILLSVETQSKEYDGLTNTEIKLLNIKGIHFNDNIFILNYKSEFKDPSVGTNKLITVSDIEFGGIDKDNYYCDNFIIISSIVKRKLTLKYNNIEKIYNNKKEIELKLEINNLIDNDELNIKSYDSYFDNSDVGDNKKINITKIKLEGKSLSNYFINDITILGRILPAYLDLEFKINDKIFDKTTKADVNICGNYDINFEAYYEDSNVGYNKKIIINIINYNISNYLLYDKYFIVGNIIPKDIVLEYVSNDKIFDNSKSHDITLYYNNNDIKINIINYNAEFENEMVGLNKKVFITDIKLDNHNYICKDFIIYNNILKKNIKLTCSIKKKKYDGTNKVLPIIFNTDYNVNVKSYDAKYNSINIGHNNILISNINLDNKNYIVDDFSVNSEIIQKDIKINVILKDKEYDGNNICEIKKYDTQLNINILKYEAFYQNDKIGDNKIVYLKNIVLSDTNYSCYDFEEISTIVRKQLKIIFKNIIKEYDNTNNINLIIESLDGIINNENVYVESYKSLLSNTNVGLSFLYISDIKLKGYNSNNYFINDFKLEIEITKKKILYNVVTIDKKYDGNEFALINISLTDIIFNDDIYIEHYIAKYNDENIGFNKTIIINDIKIGGNDKDNYYFDDNIIIYGNILSI
jgi:hypothetical protein